MLPRFTRSIRLSTALIVTLGALACTAGSAQAIPTCPPGGKLCLETTHSPDTNSPDTPFVTQDSVVTYKVVVSNIGTATATKVTLRFALDIAPPPNPPVPNPSRRVAAVPPLPDGCSVPSAPAPNVITCSLGSVKPTGSNPREFLFNVRMPSRAALLPATSATIWSVASLTYDARASDSGNNPNDPTPETFSDAAEDVDVSVVEGLATSAVPRGVPIELSTDPDGSGPTDQDKRTAKFTLLANLFSTTAVIDDEVDDASFECPEKLKCPDGGWTDATIPAFGNPFAQFLVELNYDALTVPPGLTEKAYEMLHVDDLGNLEHISRRCTSSNPAPPCLVDVDLQKNGDLKAVAKVFGNHRFR
jgi:hypothetical protein